MRGTYPFSRAFPVFLSSPHPSALRAATFPQGEGQGRAQPLTDSQPRGKALEIGKRTPGPLRSAALGFSLALVDNSGRFPKEGHPQVPLLWSLRVGVSGERESKLSPPSAFLGGWGAILSRKNSPPTSRAPVRRPRRRPGSPAQNSGGPRYLPPSKCTWNS